MSQEQTIAITATFTAEPVEDSLAFWMDELDIPSKIAFAPFNQVFQQLLDPASLLSKNQSGINVILVRLEDWGRAGDGAEAKAVADSSYSTDEKLALSSVQGIEQNVQDLARALKSATERSALPHLVCLCPGSTTGIADSKRTAFFKQTEELMASELHGVTGVHLVTTSELAAAYPVSIYYDPHGDELGHLPFTPLFFAALGTLVARRIYAIQSTPYKVIVLDCDQTLWKGVCGEDGALGIEIDPPWKALQEFMVSQHDVGMLICVCSKNNEEDVIEVFERRPEMQLKRDHIVSWRINWRPKSENIKSLADELQLGLDSIVFIDDDPVECAEVRANCPDVLTLQLPQEPESIPRFLNHLWVFDHLMITEEDKKRSALYVQNIRRERLREESMNLEDFLAGLGLDVQISEMVPRHLARVSQLTQRTSQFNFTTIRRTEAEIQKLCRSGKSECLVVEVSDRFGDYGLVGAVIFQAGSGAINVDTFLLSCRALGRGVEHQMLAKVGELGKLRGLDRVDVTCIPTRRNQPALGFLNDVGAQFKQSFGQGFLFSFPVEFAAGTTYSPGVEEPERSSDLPDRRSVSALAGAHPSTGKKVKSELTSRIATELYDAEQIQKEVQAQKRKRPDLERVLDDVEKVLRGHPLVQETVVRVREDVADHKRLVAYVVADRKHSPAIAGHPRYKLPNNMAIVHQDKIQTDFIYKQIFEDQIYLQHGITINDGDSIIDAGANIGLFTLFVQQICKGSQICAFEPSPPTFEILRINTDLYGSNVKIFNCGLSDKKKTATLTFYPRLSGSSGYYADTWVDNNDARAVLNRQLQGLVEGKVMNKFVDELRERVSIRETFTTPLRPLSDIMIQNTIERIDLLKIDVEKSELDVLAGIKEEDWKKIRQIVMEVHNKNLLDQITTLLRGKGYDLTVDQEPLQRGTEVFMLYAIQRMKDNLLSSEKRKRIHYPLPPTLGTHLLTGGELRGFLKKKMPELMIPSDILFLDTLPRTPNGEVNRQALPEPDQTNCDVDHSFGAPRTPTEQILADIWTEVLGVEQVGIHDIFFELGGHSLSAIQVISRIHESFGVQVSIYSFFEEPTVAGLAEAVLKEQIRQVNPQEIASMLKEVEGLSDDEVKVLLDVETDLVQNRGSE